MLRKCRLVRRRREKSRAEKGTHTHTTRHSITHTSMLGSNWKALIAQNKVQVSVTRRDERGRREEREKESASGGEERYRHSFVAPSLVALRCHTRLESARSARLKMGAVAAAAAIRMQWTAQQCENTMQRQQREEKKIITSSNSITSHCFCSSLFFSPFLLSVTPCLALDCEFVGAGPEGEVNVLARVSIVNFHSAVVYDRFVKPSELVTDYRTAVSGVRAGHVHGKNAVSFKQCQSEVAELVKDKILVGHALHNDLEVLLLSHPKHLVRDTSRYKGLCPDRSTNKTTHNSTQQSKQFGRRNKHSRILLSFLLCVFVCISPFSPLPPFSSLLCLVPVL